MISDMTQVAVFAILLVALSIPLGAWMAKEIARWQEVAKAANIKAE